MKILISIIESFIPFPHQRTSDMSNMFSRGKKGKDGSSTPLPSIAELQQKGRKEQARRVAVVSKGGAPREEPESPSDEADPRSIIFPSQVPSAENGQFGIKARKLGSGKATSTDLGADDLFSKTKRNGPLAITGSLLDITVNAAEAKQAAKEAKQAVKTVRALAEIATDAAEDAVEAEEEVEAAVDAIQGNEVVDPGNYFMKVQMSASKSNDPTVDELRDNGLELTENSYFNKRDTKHNLNFAWAIIQFETNVPRPRYPLDFRETRNVIVRKALGDLSRLATGKTSKAEQRMRVAYTPTPSSKIRFHRYLRARGDDGSAGVDLTPSGDSRDLPADCTHKACIEQIHALRKKGATYTIEVPFQITYTDDVIEVCGDEEEVRSYLKSRMENIPLLKRKDPSTGHLISIAGTADGIPDVINVPLDSEGKIKVRILFPDECIHAGRVAVRPCRKLVNKETIDEYDRTRIRTVSQTMGASNFGSGNLDFARITLDGPTLINETLKVVRDQVFTYRTAPSAGIRKDVEGENIRLPSKGKPRSRHLDDDELEDEVGDKLLHLTPEAVSALVSLGGPVADALKNTQAEPETDSDDEDVIPEKVGPVSKETKKKQQADSLNALLGGRDIGEEEEDEEKQQSKKTKTHHKGKASSTKPAPVKAPASASKDREPTPVDEEGTEPESKKKKKTAKAPEAPIVTRRSMRGK